MAGQRVALVLAVVCAQAILGSSGGSRSGIGAGPAGFGPAHTGEVVANATLRRVAPPTSIAACADACLALAPMVCNGFNWHAGNGSCELLTWTRRYTVAPAADPPGSQSAYYSRLLPHNNTRVEQAMAYAVDTPLGGVRLLPGGEFERAFEANTVYLGQYPTDDMLFWFRKRSGQPAPGKSWGWDNGGPDAPYGLRGSIAGLFMMGASNYLRWGSDGPNASLLAARLNTVVEGIKAAQGDDGFAMAFPRNESFYHENPDYVTSWLAHGLLEAHLTGQADALQILRDHFDWFNYETQYLAQFLPPNSGWDLPGGPWSVVPQQRTDGHDIYLIYQGMIHNTRLALSDMGTWGDVHVVSQLYEEAWWLRGLAARNLSDVWERRHYPHNYELTGIEAYLDMFIITGNRTYLDAVLGAWDLFRDHWIHVGGSIAINEGKLYPPGSYSLSDALPTGELCGSSFWIRINQRLHRLYPSKEIYVAEMERSLFNVALANQAYGAGIRYYAHLDGHKNTPTNFGTCCESQGTRTIGSLPEFLFSTASTADAVYLNILQAANFSATLHSGARVRLALHTAFPLQPDAHLTVLEAPAGAWTLHVRVPSWSAEATMPISVTDHPGAAPRVVPGTRGSFAALPNLGSGATVSFAPAMALRVSDYNGTHSAIPCYARAAVEYGPILLAAKGPWTNCSGQPCLFVPGVAEPSRDPARWLRRAPGAALAFDVPGANITFVPYYSIGAEQFTAYPTFAAQSNATTCGLVTENYPLETAGLCLQCPAGQTVANVTQAFFGTVKGSCATGLLPQASCQARPDIVHAVVAKACLGRAGCSVPANVRDFGPDPCPGVYKQLAARVACT